MVVQRSLILERHDQLVNYNGYAAGMIPKIVNQPKRDYLFECHLTVDERYFILHDEVFDIQEQSKLGNLWDSVDIFKTIFKNVSIDNPEYRQIQEGWESLPILENGENLHALRDFLLEWSFFDDTWVGRKLKDAGEGIKDFVTTSWDGIKKMGVAISKGDWSEILSLLGKGVLYVLRKLKQAAYSTLGIIVDAILIATGIGKTGQIVAWGLITALDVYQLMNNDYSAEDANNPMWYKILELGFDILGLVSAGVAAKGARGFFSPFKSLKPNQMAAKVAKSPRMKSFIKKIYEASKSGASKMKSIQKTVSSKWGAGGRFIGNIMGGLGKMIGKLQEWCGKILGRSNLKGVQNAKVAKGGVETVKTAGEFGKRALVPATVATGVSYGIEKYMGTDKGDDIEKYLNTDGGPVFGVELDQDALDL